MVRAFLCAGLLALSVAPCFADPDPAIETTTQTMNEWEAAAVEAQKAAEDSVEDTIKASETLPSMPFTGVDPANQTMQDAVLETIMKEVQSIFTNTLTMPGWENVEQASETVKNIVDRVRDRMATTDAGRTTAALRGVTTDLLKEIMVQEAVIETLWAVIRDTQVRPWITNEHQALHVATTQAVNAYLSRMQERMRYAGFTDEDINKMLPRTKTCGREGPNGMYETCPERNMGKRYRGYGGYGYGYPVSYGYGYPASYSYGYPVSYGYGYPVSYGYPSYGYSYGYPSYGYGGGCCGGRSWRRLAEMAETPEGPAAPMTPPMPPTPMVPPAPLPAEPIPAFPLTGFGPFSRTLAETMPMPMPVPPMPAPMPMPMDAPVDPMMPTPMAPTPMTPTPMTPTPMTPNPMTPTPMTPNPMAPTPMTPNPMMQEARNLGHGYRSFRYGYPSYGYGYARPAYGYSYPGYGYSYPGYGYGYPVYYSYPGYGYGYPGYGYSYGYGRRYGWRRLEVPEPEFAEPLMTMGEVPTAATKPTAPTSTPATSPFRRNSPMTAGVETQTTEEPFYESMEQPQGAWEAVF